MTKQAAALEREAELIRASVEDVSSQVEEVKEVTQKVPAEELATKDELQALADKLPAEGGGLTPQELGERVEAMEKKAEEAAANEVPISSILHTANRTVSERIRSLAGRRVEG